MAKTKKFADGGAVAPNTYPFANTNAAPPATATDTSVKVGATPEPLGGVMGAEEPVAMFKKGGMVSKASKRADGCATKGKTKGRYI